MPARISPSRTPRRARSSRTVPDLDAGAVAELARKGREAQPRWEAFGFEARAQVLKRAQKWLMDNHVRMVETIISETGKTYEDAMLAEIGYAANAFGFWAANAPKYLADEKVRSSQLLVKGKKLIVRYRPLGLVGVIGPWNYPLTNSFGDCIPALAAGNSVILKPSRDHSAHLAADGRGAARERHARGRLPGRHRPRRDRRGADRARGHDHVHGLARAPGARSPKRAARRLIPCSLELGGKDPMIVLADADLERAANVAVYYSMQNAGQTCISIERVYVEAPAYDEFVGKVTEKMKALRVGAPHGPGSVEVGAITFPPQLETIESHVKDALDKGARTLTGGHTKQDGGGRFYEPTLLVDVDHTMKIMTEETFGPTLPIMKVADAEEALRLANDSPYGLGASVFTRDTARGEDIARRIHAGAANVNDALINYTALELPMGGAKESGIGSRHAAGGIRKFCEPQSIVVTPRLALKREMHMFPYKPRTTKMLSRFFGFMYGRGKGIDE